LALVPIADKVNMPWKEPESYDEWDAICVALYNSIVIRSVESATEHQMLFPIPQHDKRVSFYNGQSFISSMNLGPDHAFICLETQNSPFDTCLFAQLDESGLVVGYVHTNSRSSGGK
jgi:hypothetical protein